MKIDRVKYTAHYDEYGVLKDQWIGLEGQIDDTEDPENKLDEIKSIEERWYAKHNPQLHPESTVPPGPPPVIKVGRTSEDTIVADLIREIYQCTELGGDHGLLSFERLASRYPGAEAAYNVMKNKLKKTVPYESLDDNK